MVISLEKIFLKRKQKNEHVHLYIYDFNKVGES